MGVAAATPYLVTVALAMTMAIAVNVQAASLGPAAISAGAARLNNGSIVNIGQPLAGVMGGVGGGLTLSVGIIPALGASTNPPPPTVGQARMEGGTFAFSFAAQPGRNYEVWASTNLADWLVIRTITASQVNQPFTDPEATNFNRRFYKVQAP
jgi:hypothetical protein